MSSAFEPRGRFHPRRGRRDLCLSTPATRASVPRSTRRVKTCGATLQTIDPEATSRGSRVHRCRSPEAYAVVGSVDSVSERHGVRIQAGADRRPVDPPRGPRLAAVRRRRHRAVRPPAGTRPGAAPPCFCVRPHRRRRPLHRATSRLPRPTGFGSGCWSTTSTSAIRSHATR